MAWIDLEGNKMEELDGFDFGDKEIDPIAEDFLIMPLHGTKLSDEQKSSIVYHKALSLMIAAYAAKDLRNEALNSNFFAAVGRRVGITDSLVVQYLYKLFLDGRTQFHCTNAVDVLLEVEFIVEDDLMGPQDDDALKDLGADFIHKTFCKLHNDEKKCLWRTQDTNLVGAHTTAAAESMHILAKSVAKTMVEMDLLDSFRDIKTCLNSGDIVGETLVKKVARLMIEKDLLKVATDTYIILARNTTEAVRARLRQIAVKLNQMQRPRSDI
ncbi:hypothetical protein F4801DRAFT_585504 [Xylaria longipes]|nr:hypothetical protein F4801DRAFT_585504 [Xylaria longipes]